MKMYGAFDKKWTVALSLHFFCFLRAYVDIDLWENICEYLINLQFHIRYILMCYLYLFQVSEWVRASSVYLLPLRRRGIFLKLLLRIVFYCFLLNYYLIIIANINWSIEK